MIRILLLMFMYLVSLLSSFAQIKSQDILIKNGNIELPGTLSYLTENAPLIVWIHGSGNIDRNGNQDGIIKANYIKQFREAINKQGIAFFSYDKRTATAKNKPYLKGIVFNDLVADAKLSIQYLKKHYRFSKTVLIGHSQGSLIGALLADEVDMYISLAGPSNTIDHSIIEQINARAPMLTEVTKNHIKELKETRSIKEVNPMLLSIFAAQNQPFLISWFAHNPSEVFKNIKKPTLIINGSKDLQIKVADAEKLHKSLPKSELVIIENMNHVLKEIHQDDDNMKSYYTSEFPISTKLVSTIVSFLKKK